MKKNYKVLTAYQFVDEIVCLTKLISYIVSDKDNLYMKIIALVEIYVFTILSFLDG